MLLSRTRSQNAVLPTRGAPRVLEPLCLAPQGVYGGQGAPETVPSDLNLGGRFVSEQSKDA
jgi:hypothetical protein